MRKLMNEIHKICTEYTVTFLKISLRNFIPTGDGRKDIDF